MYAIPVSLAVAVLAISSFRPSEATSDEVVSVTSYLTNVGEISHSLSRRLRTSSYGKGVPATSDTALRKDGHSSHSSAEQENVCAYRMIFQSSRDAPGGGTAALPSCALPSVFTQVVDFSVYAAPGRTTSAN